MYTETDSVSKFKSVIGVAYVTHERHSTTPVLDADRARTRDVRAFVSYIRPHVYKSS